jgi:Ser/Thr protein kinase RdoA (MazF antagonist)
MTHQHPFARLTPFHVVDAVCALGLELDGRITSLSSYENRVYALAQEDQKESVVAKFYRPKRWSLEQIQEEHAFANELVDKEVPMVAPLRLCGQTVHALCVRDESATSRELLGGDKAKALDFWFSVSPARGGRMPELDDFEVLEWLGRFIARLHLVGEVKAFETRPELNVQTHGWEPRAHLLNEFEINPSYQSQWAKITQVALELVEKAFGSDYQKIRLHGDCHAGNILWTPVDQKGVGGPHFVDLDDARMGPAVQDLWMLMGGERGEQTSSLSALLEGYESVRPFDRRELSLIEPLRTLRMIHYSAWLAHRVGDPAFERHFSWFASEPYWQEQLAALEDQIEKMNQPPLSV